MFEFIQEISEARIYKNGDTLKGKHAADIAKIAFLSIMMLEVLRNADLKYSKQYASSTLPDQGFTAMRPSASDLHNLLAILSNQDKYSDKIDTNLNISVPVLQLKRYLRDVASGHKDIALDRQLFKTLENNLQIHDSTLSNIRRNVADWQATTPGEKDTIIRLIKQLANSLSQQTDLYQHFKNSV